jgi:hypothetical protein
MKGLFLTSLLLIGLTQLLPNQLDAQEIELSIEKKQHELFISITLLTLNEIKILNSLDEGLEVEIFFQVRLYEKMPEIISFLGDRVILEKKPQYIAYKNLFENLYIIKNGEQAVTYANKSEFIKAFFSLKDFFIDSNEIYPDKKYYIRARVHLNHVKLDPPLNLISLFYPVGFITNWAEFPLK